MSFGHFGVTCFSLFEGDEWHFQKITVFYDRVMAHEIIFLIV
jgi:hypothetical protein